MSTYWENNGKYQADYQYLQDKLVPSMGKADTRHGEVLRCLSNIYYDCYNNGGCNLDVRQDEILLLQSHTVLMDEWAEKPSDVDAVHRILDYLMDHSKQLKKQQQPTPFWDDEDQYEYSAYLSDWSKEDLEILADVVILYVKGHQKGD